MRNPLGAILITACLLSSSAFAQEQLVTSFATFISSGDYQNSSGERLTKISEVIQQDRARAHKFGNPDGDEIDSYFTTAERRAEIPAMMGNGEIADSVIETMRGASEISIFVDVYRHNTVWFIVIRERQIKAE